MLVIRKYNQQYHLVIRGSFNSGLYDLCSSLKIQVFGICEMYSQDYPDDYADDFFDYESYGRELRLNAGWYFGDLGAI